MFIKNLKIFSALLLSCIFLSCFEHAAYAAVSKTSKRVLRRSSPVSGVASDFNAVAVSTHSMQWSWSTGTFTGSGIDGYYLHSATTSNHITLAPDTSFYIDAGLDANRQETRWLTAYDGADEGSDSEHIDKFTYALPPATFTYDQVTATGAYMTWLYSRAAAYEIQGSTNGGVDYVHNRASFIPWQTIPLLSNKNYMLRMGAINGDNELTPGVYSATRTFTTPPLTPGAVSAVALSSYTIQWSWSTGTFTGTGITGYRFYRSTTTSDDALPSDDYDGVAVTFVPGDTANSWTETFVDSGTITAANSRHTRWIKAVGLIESLKSPISQKYTYAIAPATCTVVYFDPDPYPVSHIYENSVKLTWVPRLAAAEAAQYIVEYTTTADFAIGLSTETASGAPHTVSGLTDNTKYDLRMGAINGDGEPTPANGLNPFAHSMFYRVITSPHSPSNFAALPYTDTSLDFTWSTTNYRNPSYISGYTIAEQLYDSVNQLYYLHAVAFMPGVSSSQYALDYLITNSTHTRYIWTSQTDPDFASDPNYPDDNYRYKCGVSPTINATGATFATPPNDVSFDTVTARTVGIWWREPEVPATAYRVERSTNLGERGPWVFVSSVTGSHYNDTGLTPTTTYSYRIGAVNKLGIQTIGLSSATDGNRRDYSFVRSTATLHRSPTLYGVAVGTEAITWSWTNDVAGVQTFNLYTSTDGIIASGLAASVTFWAETNLPGANTAYSRRVRSVTLYGEGDFSSTTTFTLANPPDNVTVSTAGGHSLTVGWTANGSSRYKIDRSVDRSVWTTLKSWADVFVSTSFTDSSLSYATTYYYSISGYNGDGFVSLSSSTHGGTSRTLDVPSDLAIVYSTAIVTQSATGVIPGVGQVTVDLPPGSAPDGYIYISTDAAANPVGNPKSDLDTALAKLSPSKLMGGAVIELHFYDPQIQPFTGNFNSPVRLTFTYQDSNNDGIIDGSSPQIEVGTLRVFTLDAQALIWQPVNSSVVDRAAKTVYADIPHFSYYALGSYIPLAGTLSNTIAYPNPYKPGSGGDFDQSVFGDGIVFEPLPQRTNIRIFSVAGILVADLDPAAGAGRFLWNARNKHGSRVASGLYFYVITNKDNSSDKCSGRITIIK
ncbi:MAG: hypothetical protein A2270_11350 [Elusimicrobia bacterium RIFOXYA12_FULL_51_18]|nr:MAG: hypothetical protein A2270_11350 [Elusimicrobia bacterium RIFOXYA12_FULL_51_18]OGS30232.1 MAG: hypothetical protein A2218_12110 [Elusimicrobia bacterium RIFOXYA2_FULL_53_38]